MYSPNKYHASPFLGAPARERKYLAVFKGAAAGGCLSRHGCRRTVSITVRRTCVLSWGALPTAGRTQQGNPPYSRGIRQTLQNLTRECPHVLCCLPRWGALAWAPSQPARPCEHAVDSRQRGMVLASDVAARRQPSLPPHSDHTPSVLPPNPAQATRAGGRSTRSGLGRLTPLEWRYPTPSC